MLTNTDDVKQATRKNHCPECGAFVLDGQLGCQALWDELSVQSLTDLHLAAVRDLAFDVYCMQHIEPYCHSAKSYAAHLTRLCCGLEHNGNPAVYTAINRWLNGTRSVEKPRPLHIRGQITIVDVYVAQPGQEQIQIILTWAQTVWAAYTEQHALARAWLQAALGLQKEKQR